MTDFCKVFFLGDSRSGKTALISKLVGRPYTDYRMSVGLPKTRLEANGVHFELLENPGNDGFSSNTRLFYRAAQLIVLVFSLSSPDSLEGIKRWLGEIRQFARPDVPLVLLGCGQGERLIAYEEASAQAQREGLVYTEVQLAESLDSEQVLLWFYRQIHS